MSDRARQFLPFASLRGFYEMVKEKEIIKEARKELTEEEIETICMSLMRLKKGMMIKVKYYDRDRYIEKEGIISRIDIVYKYLTVVKDEIAFEDISELEII